MSQNKGRIDRDQRQKQEDNRAQDGSYNASKRKFVQGRHDEGGESQPKRIKELSKHREAHREGKD